jgi:hypothetical protein
MRATEQLTAASIATGTRLAVVDANGTVVRTSTAAATLSDAYTVKRTLSASEWATLADPAAVGGRTPVSLSIAATNTLRAALWKIDLPVLPASEWATGSKSVFTSSTLPVEVRESLTTIASTIAALRGGESKTAVSYDVPNLSLLGAAGKTETESLVAATFQAQPFAEPSGNVIYDRDGSGAIEDVSEDLVVLVLTIQTASPAITAAWRTGGPIAAAAAVVDEVIGNFAGVNPSVIFKASFKIAGTMILTVERAEAFLVERGLTRLQKRVYI